MGKIKKELKRGMGGMAKATGLLDNVTANQAPDSGDELKSPIGMVAPTPDDALNRARNERKQAKRRGTGRVSTLISDRGSKLG